MSEQQISKSPGEPLARQLGLWDATAIIMGIIIGAGIFRVPAAVAGFVPTGGAILLAWLIGGVLCLCGALCYAELAAAMPITGGDYVYLREGYGRWVGFLFGWTKLWVVRTGSIASIAFVFAEYVRYLIPLSPTEMKIVAILAVLLLTGANTIGLRHGSNIQNIFTALKILAIVAIIVLGLALEGGSTAHFSPLWPDSVGKNFLGGFGLALIFILWTYGGWNEATYVAGEVRQPEKTLPRSLVLGISGIIVLYLLINCVYLYVLPLEQMQESPTVAAAVLERLVGPRGGQIVAIMVIISTFGALNGLILTGARISYAMGRDHTLFRWLSRVHPRFQTPATAIGFQAIWAIVLIFSGTFETLVFYTAFTTWLFFGLVALALIILRKRRPAMPRPYRVWGYPVIPVLFIAMTLILLLNAVWHAPRESLYGLGFILLGLPVYYWSASREKNTQGEVEKSCSG